jgi:23S rRNA pseudouridine955/2504/2580 synthase
MELITGCNDQGRRLDRILRKALPDIPLPLIHRLLRQGRVTVNGRKARAQDRLEADSVIKIPVDKENELPSYLAQIETKSLDIIWQDHGLLAVNKPCGLVVHGKNSLDSMVRSYLADALPASLSFTPGPLHRLDKPSSGIVIFSTGIDGARTFTALLREHKVRKTYLALLEGEIEEPETWEDHLVRNTQSKITHVQKSDKTGSKNAVSTVKPLSTNGTFTLAQIEIATGRTHQIRAQAQAHGHPLAGDRKYGSRIYGGFFLHAWKLEFLDTALIAPPPEAFQERIALLCLSIM